LAFKFRYLDDEGDFIGPVMVAKESKFVEDREISYNDVASYLSSHQHRYHKQFLLTQNIASRFAFYYNTLLEELSTNASPEQRSRIKQFPRIRFLDPLIFEMYDRSEGRQYNILVEPMLQGTYKKYNNNFGDMPKSLLSNDHFTGLDKTTSDFLLGRQSNEPTLEAAGLGAIVEEDDEEDSDDGEYDEHADIEESEHTEYFDR